MSGKIKWLIIHLPQCPNFSIAESDNTWNFEEINLQRFDFLKNIIC